MNGRALAGAGTAWLACAAPPASAQHSTAFDGEAASLYAAECVECHGDDGALVAGDLSRGRFSRPLPDKELAAVIMHGIPDTTMRPADLVSYLVSRRAP
jgi:mono/diheme cytochrome c family protein